MFAGSSVPSSSSTARTVPWWTSMRFTPVPDADVRAEALGELHVRARDRDAAAARVAEAVVEGHRAEAVERFARGDLPEGQDEIEPEQEPEDAERRTVIGVLTDELVERATVPRFDLGVAHREDLREEPRRAHGLERRELHGAREAPREARHAIELGGDGDGDELVARFVRVLAREAELGDVGRAAEVDRAALAYPAQHLAERALVAAAEHVRADVDVEALLLVTGARATDAPILLDERRLDARVREEHRRSGATDPGPDDDGAIHC